MTSISIAAPGKTRRHFLPESINLADWKSLEPYYTNLNDRQINSIEELKAWLNDLSELDSAMQENLGWLYIKMTCDTQDKKLVEEYTFFIEEITPLVEPFVDSLNRKLVECPFKQQLDAQYLIHLKQVENSILIFREENIALNAELTIKEQKYGEIAGAMSVEVDGKELTLQQATNFLRLPDRKKREEVFRKISARRQQDRKTYDELFNELVRLRNKVALNAGFANFRDYAFVEMDRFDYTPEDTLRFHESVKTCVVPLLNDIAIQRKADMKVETLKPWDIEVDSLNRADLHPFNKGSELMEKTVNCFTEIHPFFGEVTRTLQSKNFTDLDSRIGKAPGGYNYPLYETGIPFIFMNASGSLKDVITMVHEGGHAVHSMLTRDLSFIGFKEIPAEVAELASMSMELISMEHWHHFFPDATELKRARLEQLENVIELLPWISSIDNFQHWIYTHPSHSVDERTATWRKLHKDFSPTAVDWSGVEETMEAMWQKQLHLFEVPFYYIEYGIAQLGAIAVWRNYKINKGKALEQYMNALRLGYTKSIPEIYKTAGILFDFSENYIRELMDFVKTERAKL